MLLVVVVVVVVVVGGRWSVVVNGQWMYCGGYFSKVVSLHVQGWWSTPLQCVCQNEKIRES
jgi:pheromone shutdown protein TraB